MKRFFTWLLGWIWWIPVLIGAAIVGEVPWIKHAGAVLDAHRDLGVGVTVTAAIAGFVLMMGGIIASMMQESEPLSHEAVEASLKRQRDAAAMPYAMRRSRFRLKGAGIGRGTETVTSLSAMKAAWLSGDWRRDGYWRRTFTVALGAALMTIGIFGIFVVIAPMPVKLLCAGAILYPAVRLVLALGKA